MKLVKYWLIVDNDELELPYNVFRTIKECSDWLKCSQKTLRNTHTFKNKKIVPVLLDD